MAHPGAMDSALHRLTDDYVRGAIGVDTFESGIATLLSTPPADPRPAGLLDALMDHRRVACIGRDPRCELVLSNDSVSRRHVLVVRDGRRFEAIDLESTNGTRLNGRRMHRARVRPGDRLTLGELELDL